MALQRTILIVLSVDLPSRTWWMIGLNFNGFGFQPCVFLRSFSLLPLSIK